MDDFSDIDDICERHGDQPVIERHLEEWHGAAYRIKIEFRNRQNANFQSLGRDWEVSLVWNVTDNGSAGKGLAPIILSMEMAYSLLQGANQDARILLRRSNAEPVGIIRYIAQVIDRYTEQEASRDDDREFCSVAGLSSEGDFLPIRVISGDERSDSPNGTSHTSSWWSARYNEELRDELFPSEQLKDTDPEVVHLKEKIAELRKDPEYKEKAKDDIKALTDKLHKKLADLSSISEEVTAQQIVVVTKSIGKGASEIITAVIEMDRLNIEILRDIMIGLLHGRYSNIDGNNSAIMEEISRLTGKYAEAAVDGDLEAGNGTRAARRAEEPASTRKNPGGRPRTAGLPKGDPGKKLGARVATSDFEAITTLAQEEGITPSEYVRRLVRSHLDKKLN